MFWFDSLIVTTSIVTSHYSHISYCHNVIRNSPKSQSPIALLACQTTACNYIARLHGAKHELEEGPPHGTCPCPEAPSSPWTWLQTQSLCRRHHLCPSRGQAHCLHSCWSCNTLISLVSRASKHLVRCRVQHVQNTRATALRQLRSAQPPLLGS